MAKKLPSQSGASTAVMGRSHRMRRVLRRTAIAALAGTASAGAMAANYQVDILGSLPSGFSQISDMNDAGQIVGTSIAADGLRHAALWNGTGSPVDLGTLGARDATATAINNAGQIIGSLYVDHSTQSGHAVTWTNGVMSLLGMPGGSTYNYSEAFGINQSGQVVGTVIKPDFMEDATIWSHGVPTVIGGGHSFSWLAGINDKGQMAGQTDLGVTRWTAGVPTVLSLPADLYGANPAAINASGQIVGTALRYDPAVRTDYAVPLLWNGNTAVKLSSTTDEDAYASDINDSGQVAGTVFGSEHPTLRAVMWDGSQRIDLNTYMSTSMQQAGWVLDQATTINNKGWVAGNAVNTVTGQDAGFVLSVAAVPEPETGAMMLLSLAALGGVARARRLMPTG